MLMVPLSLFILDIRGPSMNLQNSSKKVLCAVLFALSTTVLTKEMALQKSLVQLIDRTRSADRYWAELEHNRTKNFMHAAPWLWFSTDSKKSIRLKRKELQETEQELAELLGALLDSKTIPTKEVAHRIVFKAKKTLHLYGVPSHATRNWITYSLVAGTIIGGYIAFQRWMNSDVLFVFESQQPAIKNLIDGSLDTKKYHYTRDEERQYLRIAKEDEATFVSLFKTKNLSFTARTPNTKDSALFFYDQDGNNVVRTFYEENGVKPIQNIKKILFKEQPNEQMFVHDTDTETEEFIKALDLLIMQARDEKRFAEIIKTHVKDTPYQDVSLQTKRNILSQMIIRAHQEIPENVRKAFQKFFETKVNSSLWYKKEIDTILAHIMNSIAIGKEQFEENSTFFSLAFQAHALHFTQRDLQFSLFMNKAHNISDKVDLNIELMATIPMMLFTYGTYKLAGFISTKLVGAYVLTPLKQDLIHFQLMLNKERAVAESFAVSIAHKGMCYYWTERCKKYIKMVPIAERSSFAGYIDQLEKPEHTPQQKLTIIECMFREYNFLR